MLKALNEKHKLFCEEYISNGYNSVNAYSVAYSKDNNNYNSMRVRASKLLKEILIQNYIRELEEQNKDIPRNDFKTYRQILIGIAKGTFDSWTYRKKGDELILTPTKPTISEQLKAIDILLKLGGYYESELMQLDNDIYKATLKRLENNNFREDAEEREVM